MNKEASASATTRSGKRDPVANTAAPAAMTAILPIASLREHSQTERTFESPSRQRRRMKTLATLAASASAPTPLMIDASGVAPLKKRSPVVAST